MDDRLFDELNEATFDTIRRKHRSINRLFPDFSDKTKGVENKGGLKLSGTDSTRWFFKVHSGTEDDLWYEDIIEFKDIEQTLKKVVMNRRIWSKTGENADMKQVTHEFLKRSDVAVKCSCPAFQYWGPAYILSLAKYDAKYGDQETRAPRIRNPRQYGAVCKHLDRVLKVLPFYGTTLTKWLKEFYGDEIARWEKTAKAHSDMFKDLGKELGKKQQDADPAPISQDTTHDKGPDEEPPEDATEAPEEAPEDQIDPKVRDAHNKMTASMRNEEPGEEETGTKKRKKKGKQDDNDDPDTR